MNEAIVKAVVSFMPGYRYTMDDRDDARLDSPVIQGAHFDLDFDSDRRVKLSAHLNRGLETSSNPENNNLTIGRNAAHSTRAIARRLLEHEDWATRCGQEALDRTAAEERRKAKKTIVYDWLHTHARRWLEVRVVRHDGYDTRETEYYISHRYEGPIARIFAGFGKIQVNETKGMVDIPLCVPYSKVPELLGYLETLHIAAEAEGA